MRTITEDTIQAQIINKVIGLLEDGTFKAGQRLPSEIELQRILNVPKTQVKSILSRLDLYNVLTVKPQSGSYLANYSIPILKHLMLNSIENIDVNKDSLFSTRLMLEKKAADLIIRNGYTSKSYKELESAYNFLCKKIEIGERGLNEDFLFHINFIKMADDEVLTKLYLTITPNILNFWNTLDEEDPIVLDRRTISTINEHRNILNALHCKDIEKILDAIMVHLTKSHQYKNK